MQAKEKLSLKDKLSYDKNRIKDAILNTPSAISQEGNVLRVKFANNTDKESKINEPQLVFQLKSDKDITGDASQIASLIADRRINEERSVTFNPMSEIGRISKGELKLNVDLCLALANMETTGLLIVNKVMKSHLNDWLTISSVFEDRGIPADNLDSMKIIIDELAIACLMANTNEDGLCPFHKQKHLAENLLTFRGQQKIVESDPSMLTNLRELNRLRNALDNGYSM